MDLLLLQQRQYVGLIHLRQMRPFDSLMHAVLQLRQQQENESFDGS